MPCLEISGVFVVGIHLKIEIMKIKKNILVSLITDYCGEIISFNKIIDVLETDQRIEAEIILKGTLFLFNHGDHNDGSTETLHQLIDCCADLLLDLK